MTTLDADQPFPGIPQPATSADPPTPSPVERFRRRPIVVETMRWDGTPERAAQIRDWVGGRGQYRFLAPEHAVGGVHRHARLWVERAQAWVPVPVGHRVVREPDGSGFYPISPDAVAVAYDPVEVA